MVTRPIDAWNASCLIDCIERRTQRKGIDMAKSTRSKNQGTTEETAEQQRHDVAVAERPAETTEGDRGLQPAAGPTGLSDGDD